jgi:hypothetical protein
LLALLTAAATTSRQAKEKADTNSLMSHGSVAGSRTAPAGSAGSAGGGVDTHEAHADAHAALFKADAELKALEQALIYVYA